MAPEFFQEDIRELIEALVPVAPEKVFG